MPTLRRKRYLGPEQRRALQLIAGSPFGATEATLWATGFERRMLATLIRAGLVNSSAREPQGWQSVYRAYQDR